MLFHFYLYTTSPPRDAASLGMATAEEDRSAALAAASGTTTGMAAVFLFFTFIILVVPRRGGIGVIGGPQVDTGCGTSCTSPCGGDSFRTLLGGGRH